VRRKKNVAWYLVIILMLAGYSCTTVPKPDIFSVWKDDAHKGYFEKVLVIGVARKEATRAFFEDELAANLRRHGVDAVPSHEVIPSSEDLLNKAGVEAKIKGSGIDSILITRLIYTFTTETNIRPKPDWQEYYTDSYGYKNVDVYAPRLTGFGETARLEIQVFETGSEKLLWSASADVFFRDNLQGQIKEFINILVEKLSADRLIP